jgi:hypothetical protein
MMHTRSFAITSILFVGLAGCGGDDFSEHASESNAPWSSDTEVSRAPQLSRDAQCRTQSVELSQTVCAPSADLMVTDLCDDESYADVEWASFESEHFVLHTLPGTAAHADVAMIAVAREAAYDEIRASLGIEEEPVIEVYLSPNRLAADAHGVSARRAFPEAYRYEVVYTGHGNGYESVRYGHELTHVLAHRLEPSHSLRLGVLVEGLAEYLDQSDRDLHAAYANNLVAGVETRARLTRFEDSDVSGANHGRAGSLVKFLIERYGMAAFVDIYERAFLEWSDDCYGNPGFGCVATGDDVAGFLDVLIEQTTGEQWVEVEPKWRDVVSSALRSRRPGVSNADRQQIAALFGQMDVAMASNDPAAYRATMEGFYCDSDGEQTRMAIARRAVEAYGEVESTLLNVVSVGVKSFPAARATILRSQADGSYQALSFDVERLPEGWRVAWGPDWY